MLLIIVAFAFIVVGRRLQRMVDLWARWRKAIADLQAAIAALPGIRGDAWRGVATFAKVTAVALIILWAADHFGSQG